MVFPLILAAAGVGLAGAGAFSSFLGSKQQSKANEAAIAAQQRMLAIQEEARRIDADRRRRQFMREAVISRSQALARGTAQGASSAGSSALPGAYGQIAGRAGWMISGVNQAERTSQDLYAANQELFRAKLQMGEAQETQALGSSLSSFGGAILGNLGSLNNMFGGGRGMSYGNTQVSNTGQFYNSGAGAPYAP